MNLRNWRIGTRLGVGFGMSLVILIATVVLMNAANVSGRKMLIAQAEAADSKSALIAAMQSALLEAGIAMRDAAIQADPAAVAREISNAQAHLARHAQARAELARQGLSAAEKMALARIEATEGALRRAFLAWSTQAPAAAEAAARMTEVSRAGRLAAAAVDKFAELHQGERRSLLEASSERDRKAFSLLALVCAAAVACGGLISWRLTLSITRPLQTAVSIARRVAIGDLSSQPNVAGRDEVSDLVRALKAMNDHLLKLVGDVRQGGDSIATASKEIASGNADLSTRTEAQAGSLEITASSMKELTETVRQNADDALSANRMVLSSSEVAMRGGQAMREAVKVMEAIRDSSGQIADIVNVIDSIAFQTNILALNAAVEAARAGEEGRGFAVVASEVRNLAQRSAGAAREIKALIGGSVDRINAGSTLVVDVGRTMDEIVESVRCVADIMGKIAKASQEQTTGIEEINLAIAQMEAMTQQNAALVEQASAAAESMRMQAASLAQAVSVFRLESNTSEAVDMVRRAVACIGEIGMRSALAAFSQPDPAFKHNDLYINVIDTKGNTLAHGENAALIGKNLIGLKDADGKAFIKEFVRVATTAGKGWIDYRWPNPVTGVIESKSTYVEKIDEVIVGCGIYK